MYIKFTSTHRSSILCLVAINKDPHRRDQQVHVTKREYFLLLNLMMWTEIWFSVNEPILFIGNKWYVLLKINELRTSDSICEPICQNVHANKNKNGEKKQNKWNVEMQTKLRLAINEPILLVFSKCLMHTQVTYFLERC